MNNNLQTSILSRSLFSFAVLVEFLNIALAFYLLIDFKYSDQYLQPKAYFDNLSYYLVVFNILFLLIISGVDFTFKNFSKIQAEKDLRFLTYRSCLVSIIIPTALSYCILNAAPIWLSAYNKRDLYYLSETHNQFNKSAEVLMVCLGVYSTYLIIKLALYIKDSVE
jgi:hypothetical protein